MKRRKAAWPAWAVAALALAAASGCLQGREGGDETPLGVHDWQPEVYNLSFAQSQMPPRSDWVAYEVKAKEWATPSAIAATRHEFKGGLSDPVTFICPLFGMGTAADGGTGQPILFNLESLNRNPIFGTSGNLYAGATGLPVVGSAVQYARFTQTGFVFNGLHLGVSDAGESVFLFFGIPSYQVKAGATMNFTFDDVTGKKPVPFTYRQAASGTMACGGSIRDFEEGSWAATTWGMRGEDLAIRRNLEHGAVVWMRAAANGGFSARINSPSGAVWNATHGPVVPGTRIPVEEKLLCSGETGEWSLEIPDIASAGYHTSLVEFVIVDINPQWHHAFNCAGKDVSLF